MDAWTLYLVSRCDAVRDVLGSGGLAWMTGLASLALCVVVVVRAVNDGTENKDFHGFLRHAPSIIRGLATVTALGWAAHFAMALIPTTEQATAIAAAHGGSLGWPTVDNPLAVIVAGTVLMMLLARGARG